MLANYFAVVLLVGLKQSITADHRLTISNRDNVISLSSVLGSRLVFNVDDVDSKAITWYKGAGNLKPLISNAAPSADAHDLSLEIHRSGSARHQLVNGTKLIIEQTFIGDEGFYTLTVGTDPTTSKHYLYHVVLFTKDLSLSLSPSHGLTYQAEEQINVTCSILFYADRSYIEQSHSVFLSTWYIILHNNDPDHQQLSMLPASSYRYTASLIDYELSRNDHQQRLTCTLFQHDFSPMIILNATLADALNIEYKAHLQGNYYFTRSFNSFSSIEINCEEFDANPKAVYTLIWILNGRNQTLLNQTKHGRYRIANATWHHRGNYICFAENYLNRHQPVHQLFRLNVWLTTSLPNAMPQLKVLAWQRSSSSKSNRSIILILLIILSAVACLLFILSLCYFCSRTK